MIGLNVWVGIIRLFLSQLPSFNLRLVKPLMNLLVCKNQVRISEKNLLISAYVCLMLVRCMTLIVTVPLRNQRLIGVVPLSKAIFVKLLQTSQNGQTLCVRMFLMNLFIPCMEKFYQESSTLLKEDR